MLKLANPQDPISVSSCKSGKHKGERYVAMPFVVLQIKDSDVCSCVYNKLTQLTTTASPWAAYGWLLWQSFSGCLAAVEGWWFAESSKLCQEEAWLQSKKNKQQKQTKNKTKQGAWAQLSRGCTGKERAHEKVRIPNLKSLNSEINLGTPGEMQ